MAPKTKDITTHMKPPPIHWLRGARTPNSYGYLSPTMKSTTAAMMLAMVQIRLNVFIFFSKRPDAR